MFLFFPSKITSLRYNPSNSGRDKNHKDSCSGNMRDVQEFPTAQCQKVFDTGNITTCASWRVGAEPSIRQSCTRQGCAVPLHGILQPHLTVTVSHPLPGWSFCALYIHSPVLTITIYWHPPCNYPFWRTLPAHFTNSLSHYLLGWIEFLSRGITLSKTWFLELPYDSLTLLAWIHDVSV